MTTAAAFLSDHRPDTEPFEELAGTISGFAYSGTLATEIAAGGITGAEALDLLDDMLSIRELEDTIVRLRSGGYEPLPGYDYRGPTHVSIGQEASPVGACSVLRVDDNITSSHRGHGDAVAKGFAAIRSMSDAALRARAPGSAGGTHEEILEAALEEHIYRVIAELFGKDEGYGAGRGGGMHIGDFSTGNLGANAIVGGSVPIATGAAMAHRYERSDRVVCCFAGDGAYANGVVLESLNWAAQAQWTNHLAGDHAYGLPVIYFIQNNHYGMTHHTDDEVMGVRHLARRAAGFAENNMHAETIDGMDVLAVRDAVRRAVELCRAGDGPVLIEASTYRYYGHSLSDPRNEYRTRDEEASWRAVDAIERLKQQILAAGVADEATLSAVETRVRERNARAAVRASKATDPDPADALKFLYTDTTSDTLPTGQGEVALFAPLPVSKRAADGAITYRDALREALAEEMVRDRRVIFYGEDVADYGGAFKLTKGLLESFGRERVFNTPISEAAICGTAVGAAIVGLRPVVELMYMDFALMASDQIANQAAKWHFMSGGQVEVPLVVRASVGRREGLRRTAQPVAREPLYAPPRHLRRLPIEPGRRQGSPEVRDPHQQPGPLRREPGPLSGEGPGSRRGAPRPDRRRERCPGGNRRDARRLGPGRAGRPRRGRSAGCRGWRGGGGHRPAQPRPVGPGHRAGLRPQDRPLPRCQPGRARRQLRERGRGAHPGGGVRLPRRTDRADRRHERHLAAGPGPGAGVPAQRGRHLRGGERTALSSVDLTGRVR